jgi:hypothetical protein
MALTPDPAAEVLRCSGIANIQNAYRELLAIAAPTVTGDR